MSDCPGHPARRVEDTDTFFDSEDGARRLWDDGFRPLHAHQLERGHVVAYVQTFFSAPLGDVMTGYVEDLGEDEWGTVLVSHTGGPTSVDECDEVWAREAKVWEGPSRTQRQEKL